MDIEQVRNAGEKYLKSSNKNPEETLLEQEKSQILIEALERVKFASNRSKKVLEMYFFKGLNDSEIAKIEGVSVTKIGENRRKALKDLRRYFFQHGLAPDLKDSDQ